MLKYLYWVVLAFCGFFFIIHCYPAGKEKSRDSHIGGFPDNSTMVCHVQAVNIF